MADVKYEDEKLLTSDEFIKTAKENADKKLQIQKDTAQKVFNSTYASLERQYDEAATAAGVAKQRNLIDTDTAYQRQELKYGAEQEALAAAGLSGSGINEYRRAQSYQQNREDRQMSYAEYDRALREAAYTRDQGKLAADITKAQADADADILYNDTMTGISEKELGYADLERQEIDSAYSGYLAGIEDGSLTLDQIRADSSWAKLSPEQQAAVITASTVKGLKGRIDNGESWEEIETSDAYKGLNNDGKNQVAGYHAQVEAGKTKDANAALGRYLEMANAGWSIDDIVAAATGNGHYDILTESGAWQSVANAVSSYADDKAAEETVTNINNAIANGATLEEIQDMEGYDDLDDITKANIEQAVNDRDVEYQTQKEQISAGLRLAGYTSVTDVEDYLASEGVPASDRAEYIAQWQADMTKRTMEAINKNVARMDDATVDMLVDGLKNGANGENATEIVNAYYESAVKALSSSTTTLGDIATMLATLNDMPRNIVGHLINDFKNAMRGRVVLWSGAAPTNNAGKKIKQANAITDSGFVATLDAVAGTNTYLEFDGKSFYKKGGVWYNMVVDNGSTPEFDWKTYNEMVLGMPD